MHLPCDPTLEHSTCNVLLFTMNEQGQVVLRWVSVPTVNEPSSHQKMQKQTMLAVFTIWLTNGICYTFS